MAFPEVERVVYEKNPLQEVICQLRFPPILKIEAEAPAGFQDRLRGRFPYYRVMPAVPMPGLPESLSKMLALNPMFSSEKIHEFTSRDQKWKVALAKDFLALTSGDYRRWEEFKEYLQGPLAALKEKFDPPFFTRIGLRYRDVIRRSVLDLAKRKWSELLQPWVAGVLAKDAVAPDVKQLMTELLARLPGDQGMVHVHYGLAPDQEAKEDCYIIDADFFDEKQTEPANVTAALDALNRQSRFLFRWFITDTVHEAMGPHEVSPA